MYYENIYLNVIRHTIENEALYPCRGRFLSSKIFRRNSFLSFRAFRGRPVVVTVRINTGQNRQTEDFEYPCHSNETWGQIRRMISNRYVDLSDLRNHKQNCFFFFRYKTTYGVLELYRNNDIIFPIDDNKTLALTDGRDRIVSLR